MYVIGYNNISWRPPRSPIPKSRAATPTLPGAATPTLPGLTPMTYGLISSTSLAP